MEQKNYVWPSDIVVHLEVSRAIEGSKKEYVNINQKNLLPVSIESSVGFKPAIPLT